MNNKPDIFSKIYDLILSMVASGTIVGTKTVKRELLGCIYLFQLLVYNVEVCGRKTLNFNVNICL